MGNECKVHQGGYDLPQTGLFEIAVEHEETRFYDPTLNGLASGRSVMHSPDPREGLRTNRRFSFSQKMTLLAFVLNSTGAAFFKDSPRT